MHVPSRVIRPLSHSEHLASAQLPTKHGTYDVHVFRSLATEGDPTEKDHVALVYGDLEGARAVPVRVHSECITSEVFGSLKCDCREQLEAAMAEIVRRGGGAVFYLRQEGRGIGLANKIRAYELQAEGADTVDANRILGLPDDARRYDIVKDMVDFLGIASVKLLTNNPAKVTALRLLGIDVIDRESVIVATNPLSEGYLETKRVRMSHDLPVLLKRIAGE